MSMGELSTISWASSVPSQDPTTQSSLPLEFFLSPRISIIERDKLYITFPPLVGHFGGEQQEQYSRRFLFPFYLFIFPNLSSPCLSYLHNKPFIFHMLSLLYFLFFCFFLYHSLCLQKKLVFTELNFLLTTTVPSRTIRNGMSSLFWINFNFCCCVHSVWLIFFSNFSLLDW